MKKADISHHLNLVSPQFLNIIENMTFELAQWIQYRGLYVEDGRSFMSFKSSTNGLRFDLQAGFDMGQDLYVLKSRTYDISNHFNTLVMTTLCAEKKKD